MPIFSGTMYKNFPSLLSTFFSEARLIWRYCRLIYFSETLHSLPWKNKIVLFKFAISTGIQGTVPLLPITSLFLSQYILLDSVPALPCEINWLFYVQWYWIRKNTFGRVCNLEHTLKPSLYHAGLEYIWFVDYAIWDIY